MFSFNNKISVRQFQILLILNIFGTGVAVLPRTVGEKASVDGYFAVFIATAAACALSYIMVKGAQGRKGESFVTYMSSLFSKPIAYIICLIFAVRLLLITSFELRIFGETVRKTMLNETPYYVVGFVMLAIAGYCAAKGYETRARLAEIIIIFALLPFIIFFGISAAKVDFTNLLPILRSDPRDLASASYTALYAFNGLELIMLAYPFLRNQSKAARGAVTAIAVVGLMMTVTTAITTARFSEYNLQRQQWPVFEMMDSVDLPGGFFERQEAVIMTFWIISAFALMNACLFFSSMLLKDIFKKGKHSLYLIVSMVFIFIVSFIPQDLSVIKTIFDIMNGTLGLFFIVILPIVIWLISLIKRRVEK